MLSSSIPRSRLISSDRLFETELVYCYLLGLV